MRGFAVDGSTKKKVLWPFATVALIVIAAIGSATYIFLNSGKPAESTAALVTPASPLPSIAASAIVPVKSIQEQNADIQVQPQQVAAVSNKAASSAAVPTTGRNRTTTRTSAANSPVTQAYTQAPQQVPAVAQTEAKAAALPQPILVQETTPPLSRRQLLVADMAKCREEGFLGQVVCVEKAKWKYCDPDLWGRVPECPGTARAK